MSILLLSVKGNGLSLGEWDEKPSKEEAERLHDLYQNFKEICSVSRHRIKKLGKKCYTLHNQKLQQYIRDEFRKKRSTKVKTVEKFTEPIEIRLTEKTGHQSALLTSEVKRSGKPNDIKVISTVAMMQKAGFQIPQWDDRPD